MNLLQDAEDGLRDIELVVVKVRIKHRVSHLRTSRE